MFSKSLQREASEVNLSQTLVKLFLEVVCQNKICFVQKERFQKKSPKRVCSTKSFENKLKGHIKERQKVSKVKISYKPN